MVMEPKYYAEEVIEHPNHHLTIRLDAYGMHMIAFSWGVSALCLMIPCHENPWLDVFSVQRLRVSPHEKVHANITWLPKMGWGNWELSWEK